MYLLLGKKLPSHLIGLKQQTFRISQFLWFKNLGWLTWVVLIPISAETSQSVDWSCSHPKAWVGLEYPPQPHLYGYWLEASVCHLGLFIGALECLHDRAPSFLQSERSKREIKMKADISFMILLGSWTHPFCRILLVRNEIVSTAHSQGEGNSVLDGRSGHIFKPPRVVC